MRFIKIRKPSNLLRYHSNIHKSNQTETRISVILTKVLRSKKINFWKSLCPINTCTCWHWVDIPLILPTFIKTYIRIIQLYRHSIWDTMFKSSVPRTIEKKILSFCQHTTYYFIYRSVKVLLFMTKKQRKRIFSIAR